MAENYDRQIVSQDAVVTINRTSQIGGGLVNDLVSIDSVIQLSAGEAQDLVLAYPTDETDAQQAYLRILGDLETRFQFQSPVPLEQLPPDMREALAPVIEADRQKWDQIQRMANKFAANRIELKAGDAEVKFYRQKQVAPGADGVFQFTLLAPFAGLRLQNAGTLSLIIHLPRNAQYIGTEVTAVPDGLPIPQPQVATVGGRTTLHWLLQYDPLFKISYRY